MKKENYLNYLINYLSEFRTIFLDSSKTLKSVKDYYKENYNEHSCTDTSTLKSIENLYDKFSYVEKYIDVILDFYKEKI